MSEFDMPKLISAKGLAEKLGVSEATIWRLNTTGMVPIPVRLGRSVRWRADEIDGWIVAGCPPRAKWKPSLN